jgi:hypothetical protein
MQPTPACLQVIPCDAHDQPTKDQMLTLLAVAVYLRALVVFDEFGPHWPHLPDMLECECMHGMVLHAAINQ